MPERLLTFALVLTRISAFFLILPVFGWQSIPVQMKVALPVLLSVFFAFIAPAAIDPASVSPVGAVVLMAGEATYGLAMGLIAYPIVRLLSGRIRGTHWLSYVVAAAFLARYIWVKV